VGGVGLDVAVEVDEVVDGSDHGESHYNYPHGVDDVALNCAVDEYTVT